MQQFFSTMLPTLGVMVIGATGYFAYKHPDAFKPLYQALLCGTSIFLLLAVTFQAGSISAQWALFSFIESGKYDEAQAAAEGTMMFQSRWEMGYFALWCVYLVFLRYALPALLAQESTKAKPEVGST